VNSSLVGERNYRDDINVIKVPMTEIANEIGNPKGANLVMLGALAVHTGLFTIEELDEQVTHYFEKKGKFNPKNSQCLYAGAKL
jgi:2-oxoglutarate ferredoxin oxidoreductase subunit gamma